MKSVIVEDGFFEGAVSFEIGDGWIRPWRLPFDKLKLFPPEDGIIVKAKTSAGVRLRFRTDSSKIQLSVKPTEEPRLFDLTIDGELIQTATVEAGDELALFDKLPQGQKQKTVELWLPQRQEVALNHILIDDDAEISIEPDTRPKWITYGSSISHCGAAHSPARTWPATVARKHNLNLTCLGYDGNCHIEPMMARLIRDLPADFISLKLGINVCGSGSLNMRTFKPAIIGMVQIIREKHSETPIAVVSPIINPPRETTPNAVGMTLQIMRDELADAVTRLTECGDDNIYYFSGLDIFGEKESKDYLPDELHPDGDGYEVLAENFSRIVMEALSL